MESPSSVMSPFFANQSCDPFQPRDSPCDVGAYVRYTVNATDHGDVSAAVRFAQDQNIRLVVRNTGHDYLGRSTGAGALAVWTHYMKDIEVLDWTDDDGEYQGKAIKVGAGVQGFDLLPVASEHGLAVVSGECPSVALAGGYTQGGGHSMLSTSFGLAADNALAYEVITASGELVTASRSENADLYWALSGGGPGTFGVVVSMTVRAHPDARVSGFSLSVPATGDDGDAASDPDAPRKAADILHETLADMVDAGVMMVYAAGKTYTRVVAATAYNTEVARLRTIAAPLLAKLDAAGVKYSSAFTEFPTYMQHFDHYYGPLPFGSIPVGNAQWGGRLVKRSQLAGWPAAMNAVVDLGADVFGVATDVSSFGRERRNSVLPTWREAIVMSTFSLPWSFDAPWSEGLAAQANITEVLQPIVEAATPGSGAYINEADFRQPDWQEAFFGSNYEELLRIKKTWDPQGLFYSVATVGSEAYTVRDDGRLCAA